MKKNKQALLNTIHSLICDYCDKHFDFSFHPEQPLIKLHEPTINGEEVFAAVQTMLSTFTTMGKKVRGTEAQYAHYTNILYSVMSNSGSSANLLAIADDPELDITL